MMMTLKNRGKRMARVLLHQGGWLRGVRYWHREAFRILMYHDFPSHPSLADSLERQCAHIARQYHIVSLADIGRHLHEGTPLPPNALAVTVDDGNRDFLANGYPVFRAHHIPVTVFLVSGFLDGKLWLWWDQLRYAVEHSEKKFFQWQLSPGRPPVRFAIETAEQREYAIAAVASAMKALSRAQRAHVFNGGLVDLLGVQLPKEPPLTMAPLDWREVRELAHNGVEFGAHTETHPVLATIDDPQEHFREIAYSKMRIELEINRPVLHFCYPYGRWEDFNNQTLEILKLCGFQTAVTAQHGLNDNGVHPYKLMRLSVDPVLPEYYFEERLTGLHAG